MESNSGVSPFIGSAEKYRMADSYRLRPSPAERGMLATLQKDKNSPRWEFQVVILGWIVDFYFPERNLVLEIDGSYHDKDKDDIRDRVMEQHGLIVSRVKAAVMFDREMRESFWRNFKFIHFNIRTTTRTPKNTWRHRKSQKTKRGLSSDAKEIIRNSHPTTSAQWRRRQFDEANASLLQKEAAYKKADALSELNIGRRAGTYRR